MPSKDPRSCLRPWHAVGYLTVITEGMKLKIKRVYEQADKGDGFRILVDRVWPRGMTKEKAAVDLWMKEVAPSTALRKWFGHDAEKWSQFRTRYLAELTQNQKAVTTLKTYVKKQAVTLVYSAKDEAHNQAVVLQELLSH